jgi:site-specific recombinase XerD
MLVREVTELFLHNRKFQLRASVETIKTYTYALKQFIEFMEDRGKATYQTINRVDILAFNEHIRKQLDDGAWSLSKYVLVIKTLKAMFRWMEKDDDCKEEELKSWRDRLPKGAKAPKRDHIPSTIDLKTWQRAFNTKTTTGFRDYMMFSVMLETGVRRGELATIQDKNVQLDRNLIYVTGKTGDRIVTITKELADRLKAYMRKKKTGPFAESPYLFPSRMNLSQPVNAQYVTQVFRRIKKKLGLPKLTPHTLRHAFCTYYLINGGNVENLRVQSGHKTYSSMLHYMHLAKVGGKQAAAELEKASPLKMLNTSSR